MASRWALGRGAAHILIHSLRLAEHRRRTLFGPLLYVVLLFVPSFQLYPWGYCFLRLERNKSARAVLRRIGNMEGHTDLHIRNT